MEFANDIINTRRLRKYKNRSEKCMRDHEQIFQRIRLNGIKMDFVSAYIDREIGYRVTYLSLLSFAMWLTKRLDIKIDRLAKRNRNALLCWYAENWDTIQPHINELKTYITKMSISNDGDMSSPANDNTKLQIEEESVDPSNIFSLLNNH